MVHKESLSILSKGFCIYSDDHMIFIFQFVNVIYHIAWFEDIESPLHPWSKSTWLWCMAFLNVLLNLLC